jgi:hypothetical protein|tara:strand:+ start:1213 stop:2979 length:1767 start_codon:yes stop_codon:yes gene_type:complete
MSTFRKLIKVQVDGAEKAEKQIKGVNGGLENMAKKAMAAAGAYFGSQALLSAVRTSIDLFAQQEEAEKKLRFAAGEMTDALISQAEALQKNTRFGDEAIIAQQAYLASLDLSEQQIKDTISASVDLAAATGMTLESAVMNTSKTLSGMAGELGEKLGPAFRELTPEALKAGDGIKFIAEQFAGQAQSDAESFGGKLDQMKNAAGDAAESLGEVLAPIVIKISGAMQKAAEVFSSFMQEAQETELETLIRETKALGGNTTDLEIALNKIKVNEAMNKLGNDLRDVADIEDDITQQTNQRREYNKFQVAHMLKMQKFIEGEFDLQGNVLTLEKLRQETADGSRALYTDMNQEQLDFFFQEFDHNEAVLEQFDQRIEKLQDEKTNTLEVNRLELEKQAILEKQNAQIKQNQKDKKAATAEETKAETEATTRIQAIKGKLQEFLEKNEDKIQVLKLAGLEIEKKGAIKEAISNTHTMAQQAYKAMAGIPVIGPALGAIAYAAAFSKGMQSVETIKKAQYGADFITDGPQMMMVGEGSGPERVQVTPLADPNINGPQGQGITVNISGNVLHESFVEDQVLPQIREGLRMGEQI